MNFVWTTNFPRCIGWFWYRGPWARTGVYEVTEGGYVWFRQKRCRLVISLEGEWAGPIERPAEG